MAKSGGRDQEVRIFKTVVCPNPECGAPIGRACRYVGSRPVVCLARKRAWQAAGRPSGRAQELSHREA